MASEQTSAHSPLVVGNAFVSQYYHILHQSPELVHRFYQDSSRLSRRDAHGVMSSVTTMQAIDEKILSTSSGLIAEIKTVDAQDSFGDGVLVLVTGSLTGVGGVGRDFTQTFFLAPQDKGYFVLNDILRYAEEGDHHQGEGGLANGSIAALPVKQEEPLVPEQHVPEQEVHPQLEEEANGKEVYNSADNGEVSVAEEELPVAEVIDEVPSSSQAVVAELSTPATAAVVEPSPTTTVSGEVPKKSYASIVKVMRDNAAPFSVPISAPARPPPTKPERHAAPVPRPAPSEVPAASINAVESSNDQEIEVDGYSIYIKSLPLSATPEQLEEEFKRFGPIKPGGVQVRSNKLQGFCFGFVEFEVASAVQSAIEASPVMIGGRQAYVEEKRTNGSRTNNRGRFAPGRGYGFRNEGTRGRGSYAGRGYGRGDFNNRADFGNRGGGRGGPSSRGGGDGYQRSDYLGRGNGRTVAPGVSASA